MKKAFWTAAIAFGLLLGSFFIAQGINCPTSYPLSLSNWTTGCVIPSSWANALETTIGTTTAASSLESRVAALASSTGGASTTLVFAGNGILVSQVGSNATVTNVGVLSFNGATGTILFSAPATSTITASGTTVTGPAFTFASTTTILPFASGTQLYFAIPSPLNLNTINASTVTVTNAATVNILTVNGTSTLTGNAIINDNLQVTGTVTASYLTLPNNPNAACISTNASGTVAAGTCISTSSFNLTGSANALTAWNGTGTSLGSYGGSSCTAGSLVTSVSASGTVSCVATSTILAGYSTLATTSQYSAGYVTSVSSSLALTDSPIYQSSTGNLGINTTNPLYSLDDPGGTIEGGTLRIIAPTSGGRFVFTGAGGMQSGNVTSSNILLFSNAGLELNAGGSPTSDLAIYVAPTRDVSIGTSTDNGSAFQVSGGATVSGNVTSTGNLSIGGYVLAAPFYEDHTEHLIANTTTSMVIASTTIPGNILGSNGSITVWFLASSTAGTAGSKTYVVQYGGTTFCGEAVTTSGNIQGLCTISNRSSTNSQVSAPRFDFTATASVIHLGAVDTTQNQTLSIAGTMTSSTDTMAIENWMVTITK